MIGKLHDVSSILLEKHNCCNFYHMRKDTAVVVVVGRSLCFQSPAHVRLKNMAAHCK